jgi:hypothetical protein
MMKICISTKVLKINIKAVFYIQHMSDRTYVEYKKMIPTNCKDHLISLRLFYF